jgi:antitoxin (DNA-binding transcriptional repressor) of toxin-antitoxin stability system
MSEVVISVTEAARNFSDCVNRVRYQGTTFLLQKNGVSVARIVPEERKSCTGLELAEALAKVHLAPEEANTWSRDLQEARKSLVPQKDKWL